MVCGPELLTSTNTYNRYVILRRSGGLVPNRQNDEESRFSIGRVSSIQKTSFFGAPRLRMTYMDGKYSQNPNSFNANPPFEEVCV
jgi:hypothetical protein